ncbi:AbrB/MazE/SpoVT family DNA-binding domain-containing protein [Salinadaptatus halalkaliphilus]|uniref:AbrB/MazE/SpoVT family DNA-binding domain-containing protein n=1 Tax=Salinadaptatus halalkaliphilus TaxID=2419781 RepID=A0A4S3TNX0_9EURY|nr:AbrB/MazE/SpoVT family DNA-binding domain-containing protein [Salinadaptatus halalkaliphilus]THE66002.1 AbrB/MazE/SpoVT family DNA-binding domain-containing protein [Salinadaptatus halalkaliphilus]
MVTVDPNGRIALPSDVRDRFGLTAGTEAELREKEGNVVIIPEDDPEQIIERMGRLVEGTAPEREGATSTDDGALPIARKHRDAVRSGAGQRSNE